MENIILKKNITSADLANPAIGTGINLSGYKGLKVFAKITTGKSATITFLIGNGDTGEYFDAYTKVISKNESFNVYVGRAKNFNLRVDAISVDANLDLYASPLQADIPSGGEKVLIDDSTPIKVQLNATPTIDIGDVQIKAGEDHIGEVGGRTIVSSVEITRATPDATAYSANDAVLAAAGGLSEIANVARIAGGSGYITQIRVSTNKKSITPRLRLHFFNASNPTVSADNLPWQDKYADAGKRITYIDMPALITAADTTNSDMSRTMDATVRIPFQCANGQTSLWVGIETLDAFTPDAAQKFTIKLNTELN